MVTLQLLTVHGLVIPGVVVRRSAVAGDLKPFAILALVVIDLLALAYLCEKVSYYWRSQDLNADAERRLQLRAGFTNVPELKTPASRRCPAMRGFGGTAYFMASIAISGIVAGAAIYAA